MSLVTDNYRKYEDYANVLEPIRERWKDILEEFKSIQDKLRVMPDERNFKESWYYIPLLVEEEDIPYLVGKEESAHSPLTTQLYSTIPDIEAACFSVIKPGGAILPHSHNNRFMSCALSLQDGPGASTVVDGERRGCTEGEFVLFDYRKTHSVSNPGTQDRIALLVLIPF